MLNIDIKYWLNRSTVLHNPQKEFIRSLTVKAIKKNDLFLLEKLSEYQHTIPLKVWNTDQMDIAAWKGKLDVVKWFHSNRTEGCTTKAMDCAARDGEVVKWLHENRTEGCTVAAIDWAAKNGHFEVVKWLKRNRTEGHTQWASTWALEGEHYDIVRYLIGNGL